MFTRFLIPCAVLFLLIQASLAQETPKRNIYFGDTHLHTNYSPDAYLIENRSADPDTAYRFAKGEAVIHPYTRAKIQIGTPLDFLVVSDHSEYMGVIQMLFEKDPAVANTEFGKLFLDLAAQGKEAEAFAHLIGSVNKNEAIEDLNTESIRKSVWTEIIQRLPRNEFISGEDKKYGHNNHGRNRDTRVCASQEGLSD